MKFLKELVCVFVLMVSALVLTAPISYAQDGTNTASKCLNIDPDHLLVVEFYEPIDPEAGDIGYQGLKCKNGNGGDSKKDCYTCVYKNYEDCKNGTLEAFTSEGLANGEAESKKAMAERICTRVQILKAKTAAGLLSNYISIIYKWGASIAGLFAVLIMVYSGIQISTAGGEQQKVDEAKTRILQSISALIVLFLAGLILYTINPTFFIKP